MGRRVLAIALAVVVMCAVSFAQKEIPENLVRLIEGPQRTEISYKIQVSKPVLTFQQHYILVVGASFSHKQVEHREVRHLQVLTKLQDGAGRWLDGADYEDYRVPEKLRGHGINYATLIYVRPGRYRVNVAMLDRESGKSNVYHQEVEIGPLSKDPFPVLDELLPDTEFPSRLIGHRGFWELGNGMEPIPLSTAKPTRLDVVLNITKRFRWDAQYRFDVETMLESGSVLGRFRPEKGCVRLSVIDSLRMKVVLDRFPAENLSWIKLEEAVQNINQEVIDVHVLGNQQKIAQFTHDYLQGLARDRGGCTAEQDLSPLVVVVSPDVVLPEGNKIGALGPLQPTSFVYVHMGMGSGWSDGIGQILSTGKPEKINCANPREFRVALAKIAALISAPAHQVAKQ